MSEDPAAERMPSPLSAAARYREIAGMATSASKAMRAHENAKAKRLRDELDEVTRRTSEADEAREEIRAGARKRWELAMEALWEERWMRVTPMPGPDSSAPAADPDAAIKPVQAAYLRLREALGQPRWKPTAWLPRKPKQG